MFWRFRGGSEGVPRRFRRVPKGFRGKSEEVPRGFRGGSEQGPAEVLPSLAGSTDPMAVDRTPGPGRAAAGLGGQHSPLRPPGPLAGIFAFQGAQ
eukprot:4231637-Alexandrium_andersonii.AAC.1